MSASPSRRVVLWVSRNVLALRRLRTCVRGYDRIVWRIDIGPQRRRFRWGPSRTTCATCATRAAATTAAAAASSGKSYAASECSGIFFVEDIERCQADIKDFLLTESDSVTHFGVPRQHIRRRLTGCCGCSARQRQRQPSGAQHRYVSAQAAESCSTPGRRNVNASSCPIRYLNNNEGRGLLGCRGWMRAIRSRRSASLIPFALIVWAVSDHNQDDRLLLVARRQLIIESKQSEIRGPLTAAYDVLLFLYSRSQSPRDSG